MKGVTTEVIAEVRSRANLLEIVSEHVAMKRAGTHYSGLCPFHKEKSPSFTVNTDKGFFKCFGCGEGGDVFTFVQKVRGLEFIDAVRDLAHRYGVSLVETVEQKQEHDKLSFMRSLYETACAYYKQLLHDPAHGVIGQEYLERRGLSAEIVEKFQLGYAPAGGGLFRYLTETLKASPQTLEEAGLVRKYQDSNGYFDLFRNRLMIPICDEQGRVIAFGGRTLSADDQVKYLNSPGTPIYSKSTNLFALHLAKDAIKAKDAVIVVEGYLDAITPHQFGFTNTVATLGTAMTEQHARMLVKYTESKRVYLAFDADAAGVKAVEKGSETLNQVSGAIGMELRILKIPGGKDPDECLRAEGGVDSFSQAIEHAALRLDYQLAQAIEQCNVSTHTGKIDAAKQLVPILAGIGNAVERGEYIRQWAIKAGLREDELHLDVGQELARLKRTGPAKAREPGKDPLRFRPSQKGSTKVGFLEAEQQLLALYLLSNDDYSAVFEALMDWEFFDPSHAAIKQAIEGVGSQFNNIQDLQYKLMDRLGPDKAASAALVEIVLRVEELRKQNSPTEILLREFKRRLLKEKLNRAVSSLRLLLGSTEIESDLLTLQSRINKLNKLERESLVSAGTLPELEELKRTIEAETVGMINPSGDNA